jgi:diguanylate cyclase (GGDEF)-like protein
MADLDFFKNINDSFGHLAGDFVLKETGRIILNVLRKGDIAVRYGGEEIVFILRETALPGARIFAERLRELIANHHFYFEGKKIQVTISLGIATSTQGNFNRPEDLIAQADHFLYQAKKSGRNRSYCLIDSQ